MAPRTTPDETSKSKSGMVANDCEFIHSDDGADSGEYKCEVHCVEIRGVKMGTHGVCAPGESENGAVSKLVHLDVTSSALSEHVSVDNSQLALSEHRLEHVPNGDVSDGLVSVPIEGDAHSILTSGRGEESIVNHGK